MITLVILLLWISVSIHYRVELGPASFALMEPFSLLASGTLLGIQLEAYKSIYLLKDKINLLLLAWVGWVILTLPFSENLTHSLSDIRDWVIPVLLYITLTSTIRKGWRRLVILFLALAVLNALLGIYQHLVDGFRPFVTDLARFKTSYNVTEAGVLTSAAYAVGFFSHPNSYAIYLYLASMISLGWLSEPQRKYWKLLISGLLLTTLLYTYAKASLGVMFIAFLFFWSHRKSASPRRLILTVGLLVPGAIMLIWVLITYLPQPLLATFWWRVELWQIAIRTIWEAPWIPFVGNGMVLFAQNAFYPQPHNVYLYTLLQYGFPGLFILLLIGWVLFRQGMKAYSRGWFRQNPILGAAWAGLMGFFVIGLVESNLGGIELRSIFLILVASFTGLLRELHLNRSSRNVPRYTNSNNSSSETPYVETPNPFHL